MCNIFLLVSSFSPRHRGDLRQHLRRPEQRRRRRSGRPLHQDEERTRLRPGDAHQGRGDHPQGAHHLLHTQGYTACEGHSSKSFWGIKFILEYPRTNPSGKPIGHMRLTWTNVSFNFLFN